MKFKERYLAWDRERQELAEVGFSVDFKKKRTRLTIDFESLVEAFRQDWRRTDDD